MKFISNLSATQNNPTSASLIIAANIIYPSINLDLKQAVAWGKKVPWVILVQPWAHLSDPSSVNLIGLTSEEFVPYASVDSRKAAVLEMDGSGG